MAFCAKCGSELSDQSAFCPKCGAPASGAAIPDAGGSAAIVGPATSGLSENLAGLLCYLVGWVTGIIFLFIDKRPFVRFHAAQSIAVFGLLFAIHIVLTFGVLSMGGFGMYALFSLISLLVSLLSLFAWIFLMIMAFQGKRYEVPGLAGLIKAIQGSKA